MFIREGGGDISFLSIASDLEALESLKNKKRINKEFQLYFVVFLNPLEAQGHEVSLWKVLCSGKYKPRGLSFGSKCQFTT